MFRSTLLSAALLVIATCLICSCSDKISVDLAGPEQGEIGLNSDDPGVMLGDENASSELLHVFAVDEQDEIVSVRFYDSVMELGFILSIQQVEQLENDEIVEVTEQEHVCDIISVVFGNSLSGEEGVVTVGMISMELEIGVGTSWSCMKCMSLPSGHPCHEICDKEKDDGMAPHDEY